MDVTAGPHLHDEPEEKKMTRTILLTGGTGTLGSLVLPRLTAAGAHIRVLSRHSHPSADGVEYVTGDLETSAGIDAAVTGVDTIVHCAGSQQGDGQKAAELVRAARAADGPHLVYISVVGAERMPVESRVDRAMFSYFASKREGERVVAESGLPWTTLRATQFHDLVLLVLSSMARMPVIPMPSHVRFQSVEADEVAARLVELALGEPAGLVPDLAGPEIHEARDLMRGYLKATGRRRLVLPVHLPGGAARALREGANLAPDHADGKRTWEQFLTERLGATGEGRIDTVGG